MAKYTLKDKKDLTREEIYAIISIYLHENLELSSRKMQDEENFKLPAWSEYQAFHLGQKKALQKVLDFIKPLTEGKEIV